MGSSSKDGSSKKSKKDSKEVKIKSPKSDKKTSKEVSEKKEEILEKKQVASKKTKVASAAATTPATTTDRKRVCKNADEFNYNELVENVQSYATPLASSELTSQVFNLIRKGVGNQCIIRGIKEAIKAVRKGDKGIMVMAGDVTPVDVIAHLPVVCESANIKYVFLPTKAMLGHAGNTPRTSSCMLVKRVDHIKAEYDAVAKELNNLVYPITAAKK